MNHLKRLAICNETFGDWPLDRALELSANLGYTGWEVAPFMLNTDVRQITAAQRTQYRRAVESAGLEVIGLHWLLAKTTGFHLTTADQDVRKRTADYFRALVELCADLGGKVMVLGSPLQRNLQPGVIMEQAYEHAREILESLDEPLRRHQIKIALEPLGPEEGNFLNTAQDARTLRQLIQSNQIGLHLDVKAMSTEPQDIVTTIRQNADWMIHFHANDPNRQGPGMGQVQFEPILQTLREIGYGGWISVEVFDYSPGADVLASRSIETLKSCG